MKRTGKELIANWRCYLLSCADGTLYCGITKNLAKRLADHNAGAGAKYTRGRTPVQLVYVESCVDKSAALKREMQIKKFPRSKKLALSEQLIVAAALNKYHNKQQRSVAS